MNAPRRGRPRDVAAARLRRRAIVSAAGAVFGEKGYEAGAISDIDARLEIGRGTFYRHFSSKRDVAAAVVTLAADEIVDAIRSGCESPGTDRVFTRLVAASDAVFDLALQQPGPVRMLFFEASAIDDAMTSHVLAEVDRIIDVVETEVRRGIDDNEVRGDLPPRLVAEVLIGLMHPALMRALIGELDADELAGHRRAITGLLERGLLDPLISG